METNKNNNSTCFFSDKPIFNIELVPHIKNLTGEHTVYLFSLLLLNNLENFIRANIKSDLSVCLNKKDIDFIPKDFFGTNVALVFIDTLKEKQNIEKLKHNYFEKYGINLLVRFNSIGLSPGTFEKIYNLLSVEEEVIVIGKSAKNEIVFIGFNTINDVILHSMLGKRTSYEKILKDLGKSDVFVHTLEGFELITNFDNFKNLYYKLSEKESLSYCIQEMHERFTNLFIEYKEHLK